MILVGLLLSLFLRRRSAAMRNLVLRLTLAVTCLLPFAAFVAPRVEVPVSSPAVALAPAVPSVPKVFSAPTPPITEGWSVVQPDPKDVTTIGFQRTTPFSTAWVSPVLPFLLLWGLGAGLLLLRWLVGFTRLQRIAGRARSRKGDLSPRPPLQDEPLGEGEILFAEIAVPATYGRTILLPLEAEGWPEARLRAAVEHERAHVVRRDWIWQTFAALFCAVHWANPLAWVLARALRDSAEAAADDAVLLTGLAPSAYAHELLAVAANVGPTGPALTMARRGGVRDRVVMVLAERDRRRPTRRLNAVTSLGFLIVGFAVAGLQIGSGGSIRKIDDRQARLIAVREKTPGGIRAWNAKGVPVANPDVEWAAEFVPQPMRREGRRIQFLFDVPVITADAKAMELKTPTWIVPFYTTETTRGEHKIVQMNVEMDATAPSTAPLRIGVPDGPMRPISSVSPSFTVERLPETKLVDGKPVPQVRVYTAPPKGVEGTYQFVAYGRDGKPLAQAGTGSLYHNGRFCGTFASAGPVARVAFLAQRYRWMAFSDVALRPRTSSPRARALRMGGTINLVAVVQGEEAWRPDSTRLPKRSESTALRPSLGKRAVRFEFEKTSREGPNTPGILTRDFLHRSGKPQLLIDTADEITMIAPNPPNSFREDGFLGDEVRPDGTRIVRPTFTRELDPKMDATDVRVRLSSGPVTISRAPVQILKTERKAKASSIDGRWYPGVRITALVPQSMRGETVLLRAFDAQGLMIEGSSPTAPFADGTISVTYDLEDPKQIARYEWAHRTPEFVEYKAVHLYPDP